MTLADWAFVVSLCSAGVSLASLGWNIWSKFIYPRAKVRVTISMMVIFDGYGGPTQNTVSLSATNFGPTEIILSNHAAKRRQGFLWFRRNRHLALINPAQAPGSEIPSGFMAPGFPKKLAVGERVSVYFSATGPERWIREGDLFYFGFEDSFGRYHWCSRRNAQRFREDSLKPRKSKAV